MTDLKELREEIDRIDKQMVELFENGRRSAAR